MTLDIVLTLLVLILLLGILTSDGGRHRKPRKVWVFMADTMRLSDPPGMVTAVATDISGTVVRFDSPPIWSSSDEGVATVVAGPAGDGLMATVTAVAPGVTTITATTTNANGTVVSGSDDLTVTGGEPATVTVTFTPGA